MFSPAENFKLKGFKKDIQPYTNRERQVSMGAPAPGGGGGGEGAKIVKANKTNEEEHPMAKECKPLKNALLLCALILLTHYIRQGSYFPWLLLAYLLQLKAI